MLFDDGVRPHLGVSSGREVCALKMKQFDWLTILIYASTDTILCFLSLPNHFHCHLLLFFINPFHSLIQTGISGRSMATTVATPMANTRIKNDRPLPHLISFPLNALTLQDVILDSPVFRSNLEQVAEQSDLFEKWLESFVRSLKQLLDSLSSMQEQV